MMPVTISFTVFACKGRFGFTRIGDLYYCYLDLFVGRIFPVRVV